VSRGDVLHGHRTVEQTSKSVPLASLLLRYVFYCFIFTVPFDAMSAEFLTGGGAGIFGNTFALSKMFGYLLLASSVFNIRLCYRRIPAAFVCVLVYFGVYMVHALLQGASLEGPSLSILSHPQTRTFIQLFVLFVVSYNLLQVDRIARGALWSLALSSTLLATLQVTGVTSDVMTGNSTTQGRMTSVGGDANGVASVLTVGLIILIGLAYGLRRSHWLSRRFLLLSLGVLGYAIIATGSRSAVVGLAAALMAFVLRRGGATAKFKIIGIIVVCVGLMAVLMLQSELNVERWSRTLSSGDMAARETIYPVLWQMFLEKPLIGWGPVNHWDELSRRMGEPTDPHNLYLWILTEVGLFGGVPFFLALVLGLWAAWKARFGAHGILPLALFANLLIVNITGNYHAKKSFWIVFAYIAASSVASYRIDAGKTSPQARHP
jgi:O-antigen ligase